MDTTGVRSRDEGDVEEGFHVLMTLPVSFESKSLIWPPWDLRWKSCANTQTWKLEYYLHTKTLSFFLFFFFSSFFGVFSVTILILYKVR
jgi:hypothetical protein